MTLAQIKKMNELSLARFPDDCFKDAHVIRMTYREGYKTAHADCEKIIEKLEEALKFYDEVAANIRASEVLSELKLWREGSHD